MPQSTRIALKRIEIQKKFTPYEWFFPLPQYAQILTQSIGPKSPPSLIKIQPIVTEILAVKAGQTDREIDRQTNCSENIPV